MSGRDQSSLKIFFSRQLRYFGDFTTTMFMAQPSFLLGIAPVYAGGDNSVKWADFFGKQVQNLLAYGHWRIFHGWHHNLYHKLG